jgi:hypothetical protein
MLGGEARKTFRSSLTLVAICEDMFQYRSIEILLGQLISQISP